VKVVAPVCLYWARIDTRTAAVTAAASSEALILRYGDNVVNHFLSSAKCIDLHNDKPQL
jgi:hypothetical protein